MRRARSAPAAFARIELVAILAALALLIAVVLPSLAGTRTSSDRVVCLNNLRQLGTAFHQWIGDHGERPPWWTPWCEGGSRLSGGGCAGAAPAWNGLQNNLWFQLAFLTNDLPSPHALVCPADNIRVAWDWSTRPDGGFFYPGYRNNAISYCVNLDTNLKSDPVGFWTRPMVFASDPNMRTNGLGGCSSGIQVAAQVSGRNYDTGWIDALHGANGNLLFTDGAVQPVNTIQLRQALAIPNDVGTMHFLFPR